MIDVKQITDLQRYAVAQWHAEPIDNPHKGFLNLVCRQHERNYLLWHEEDEARSPDADDARIAQVKRAIDRLNQQRNDHIEKLDDWLIAQLAARGVTPWPEASLNTETPGSVIDRLSILSLRIYHMQEQADRVDADDAHRTKARNKLDVLYDQLADLSRSLGELLDDVFAGRKRLKVYRQFKMYNDPTMNPYLYAAGKKPAA